MQISPDQGQFMAFMVRAIKATKILEIRNIHRIQCFGLRSSHEYNGRLITMDRDPVMTEVAMKYLEDG